MAEILIALTTEDSIPISAESGELIGYLIQAFADSLQDPAFQRPLLHVYEEFRKRQEIQLRSVTAKTTIGGYAVGAAALYEIDVALGFIRTGKLTASAGTQFLMRSLSALHSQGMVDAQGLKDISDEELLALLASQL